MAFPFYKQLDTMDCGPTCLRIIAKYYGKDFAIDFLREKCYISRDGVSLLGISEAAENIGFQAAPVQITWDQLVNDVNLPCVVHWNQEHFLVVYKIKKYFFSKKYLIYVSDPAHGKIKYNEDKFMHSWATIIDEDGEKAGLALLMETTPHFNQVEAVQSKTNISFLFNYFKTYRKLIFLIIISVLFASLISAIFPFLMQSIVDTGIGSKDINFILIVLMAQLMLILGQATNNFIRNRLILHVTTRVSISIISDFLGKLMRLPIAFFEKRLMGDITQRIEDYNKIQIFMSETLLSLITSVVIFLVYGIVMAKYNMMILSIFIFFSLLYVIWILLFLGKRRKLEYMRIQESSMNHSHIYHLIDEMSEIKLNNNEEKRRKDWEKTQASLFSISIKSLNMGQKQEAGALIINQTKNLLITFLSAQLVINGQISLGMMMAIQYIMGQLNAPLTQFINFVKSFQDAKISIERINEIQNREDEESYDNSKIKEIPNNQDIVLKNVVFQYEGPHSEKVLNNITLTIPAGKTTAIVGSSGSGKTTLLKLILKFYNPVGGIILCDNIPLYQYSESSWRKECGVVMQEGKIFSDTILSNVIVADENYSLDLVKQALITANIWDFVESLPLNINTKIGHNGHGLSIGQMQRVLIARAVYKNPKIVLLDEATNSLDANNEKKILRACLNFVQ